MEGSPMTRVVPFRQLFRSLFAGLLALVACGIPAFAQNHKILGGYFEE